MDARNSFVLHMDSLSVLDDLTDDQAGKLFKAIKSFKTGSECELDFGLRMAFLPFKNQFLRDDKGYQKVVERNKINGSKGGAPKKPKRTQKTQSVILEPKKADSDSDSDSDNKDVAKSPLSIYELCVDFWLKEFKPDWTFGGQQGKALKSIIKKTQKIVGDETKIVKAFKKMCSNLPEWYRNKDLPVIDSKFNEIIADIRSKKPERQLNLDQPAN